MRLSDFDFELPEHLIATRPAHPRSSARLLVAKGRAISDRRVTDLPTVLRPGDRLILNDTRVIPARLRGVRRREGPEGQTEAKVELTLLDARPDGTWRTMLKPLKKVRDGEVIALPHGLEARVLSREEATATVVFNRQGEAFERVLQEAGEMPLPPYIAARRAADAQDREDYQTVWAKTPGAVAAPTASLHFDDNLLNALRTGGVQMTHVTLHVGAGTFLPVKTDDISRHRMHAEWGEVTDIAADEIEETRAAGGRIIPVGTTAMRLIETAAQDGGIRAWQGETDIFITPGFKFRVSDALMTNFHLPKSTLLMLVSAFLGHDEIRAVYAHAIAEGYRFFSYGDASILFPGD